MWGHGAQAPAVVGLDGGAGVEVADLLVRVHGDQNVRHEGVDLVLGVPGHNYGINDQFVP